MKTKLKSNLKLNSTLIQVQQPLKLNKNNKKSYLMSHKSKNILLIFGISALLIFIIKLLPAIMFASAFAEPHSIDLNKEGTSQFISDIENYGKIFEMDDCKRYTKRINGISVRMDKKENDNEYGVNYKLILNEQNIDEEVFENFRKYLEDSKLRSHLRHKDYSLFIVDGFLDTIWGYLYTDSNKDLGDEYFVIDHYYLRVIKDLGDNWYRIA